MLDEDLAPGRAPTLSKEQFLTVLEVGLTPEQKQLFLKVRRLPCEARRPAVARPSHGRDSLGPKLQAAKTVLMRKLAGGKDGGVKQQGGMMAGGALAGYLAGQLADSGGGARMLTKLGGSGKQSKTMRNQIRKLATEFVVDGARTKTALFRHAAQVVYKVQPLSPATS
eukprot:SAG11_NODE_3660_length_2303_cov_1.401089_5_plen_168_part_00